MHWTDGLITAVHGVLCVGRQVHNKNNTKCMWPYYTLCRPYTDHMIESAAADKAEEEDASIALHWIIVIWCQGCCCYRPSL